MSVPMHAYRAMSLLPKFFTASLAQWLRRPSREEQTRGSIPAFSMGNFPGRVIPVTHELALEWLAYQASDVLGSALGLAGPVTGTG